MLRYTNIKRAVEQLAIHLRALERTTNEAAVEAVLLAACLFLAKFEADYRTGYPISSFDVSEHDIAELSRLTKATDLSIFRDNADVLNPSFCVQGSKLGIEAYADLLCGNTLTDIRTGSSLSLNADLRRLFCCVVLSHLGNYFPSITTVAVYYPRFGYLEKWDVLKVATKDAYASIRGWFAFQLGEDIQPFAMRIGSDEPFSDIACSAKGKERQFRQMLSRHPKGSLVGSTRIAEYKTPRSSYSWATKRKRRG